MDPDQSNSAQVTTVAEAIASAVAGRAARPLITFYDQVSGERTELSGVSLHNWISKTANLLVDGCDVEPGDTGSAVAVRLPPHWQSAAILLGCWTAGVAVQLADGPADVAFLTEADIADPLPALQTFATALAPMAGPIRPAPPPGVLDYVVEVRGYGDHYAGTGPVPPDAPALADGTTQAGLLVAARERAVAAGIPAGARVLVDADAYPDPRDWLLAPLAAGASIVLCRHCGEADLARYAAAERVSHRLA